MFDPLFEDELIDDDIHWSGIYYKQYQKRPRDPDTSNEWITIEIKSNREDPIMAEINKFIPRISRPVKIKTIEEIEEENRREYAKQALKNLKEWPRWKPY